MLLLRTLGTDFTREQRQSNFKDHSIASTRTIEDKFDCTAKF